MNNQVGNLNSIKLKFVLINVNLPGIKKVCRANTKSMLTTRCTSLKIEATVRPPPSLSNTDRSN